MTFHLKIGKGHNHNKNDIPLIVIVIVISVFQMTSIGLSSLSVLFSTFGFMNSFA